MPELKLMHNIRNEDDNVSDYRHLLGGDGQELRSSFRRGEKSRKKKVHTELVFMTAVHSMS